MRSRRHRYRVLSFASLTATLVLSATTSSATPLVSQTTFHGAGDEVGTGVAGKRSGVYLFGGSTTAGEADRRARRGEIIFFVISQVKTGLSALALKRQLGVSYRMAWRIHHRLMHAMAACEERYFLEGQVDDAYLGDEPSGGKAGHGSENKVRCVAAVSLSDEGHPLCVNLSPVPGVTLKAIAAWASTDLASASTVSSDGLAWFSAVTEAGCVRQPNVVTGRKPKELPECQWINTVLGKLKTSLTGSYHAFPFRIMPSGTWQRLPTASTAASASGRCINDCLLPPLTVVRTPSARFGWLRFIANEIFFPMRR